MLLHYGRNKRSYVRVHKTMRSFPDPEVTYLEILHHFSCALQKASSIIT